MPESSLILTTEQQLRLSQVQIQRLEMLGLSAEALSEKIQKEAEKNPFLEVRNPIISLDGEKGEHKERTFDYGQSLKDELDSNDESEEHDHWFERTLAVPETLSEHIVKEVSFLDISDDMKNAVIMLSTALDRDGFLKFEAEDVLKELRSMTGVRSAQVVGHNDTDSITYSVESEPNVDIRKPMFFRLASKGWAIIGLEGAEMNLEDIFIRLVDTQTETKKTKKLMGKAAN